MHGVYWTRSVLMFLLDFWRAQAYKMSCNILVAKKELNVILKFCKTKLEIK